MLEVTQKVTAGYDRISYLFDFVELSLEIPFLGPWRKKVFKKIMGSRTALLEHMRPSNYFLGLLFDLPNPLAVAVPDINRETVEKMKKAGCKSKRRRISFAAKPEGRTRNRYEEA